MDTIKHAAQAIQDADALLITAGAGMGVDSGLPDFRGKDGFWRAYPAIAKLGLSFEEMANPSWFKEDPTLAWAFYGHRLNLYQSATPHAGFKQLLEIGRARHKGYFVFTSNVDGHFQKAGFDDERIVECHGSIHHFQCSAPCSHEFWDGTQTAIQIDERSFRAREPLPKCRSCSAVARPNILMFGDWSWLDERTAAQEERFRNWLAELVEASVTLTIVELGAGSAVPTVRHMSEGVSRSLSASLIRINLREPSVPDGQIGLPLSAAEGIQQICDALKDLDSGV
jgi:NAD-dependent SIR2 family protein deacetylase